MTLIEYLERVTAGIRSNASARRVREELLAHLLALKDDALRDGVGEHEAIEIAMRRFGDPDELAQVLEASEVPSPPSARHVSRLGLTALAAACALLGFVWTPLFFGIFVFSALAGIVSLTLGAKGVWSQVCGSLRRLAGPVVMAVVLGVAIGAEPLLAAGSFDPLHLPLGILFAYPALVLATGVWAVIRIWRRPPDTLPLAALGAGIVFVVGILAGLVLWHTFPHPPSPYVNWFGGALPSVLPWDSPVAALVSYQGGLVPPFVSHPVWAASVAFLAVTVTGGIAQGVRAVAASAQMPPDGPIARLG